MPALVRFVDSITESPTVRMDVNDGTIWRLQASSRLDPPAPKRARVSTLLTDGAIYPSAAYDDRVLELHWLLVGDTTEAVATQVQLLARELDRRGGNILQYQMPGMADPVYFRTQRLGLESIEIITDGTELRIIASIPADPFAYGTEVDLGTRTVANDPAAATNPTYFDVTNVLGDVQAPVRLKKRVTGAGGVAFLAADAFATRRRGDPDGVPYLLQAESMTQGTNTTTQPNSADFSGSGNNYSRCTFGTATLQTRLSIGKWPESPSVDARGLYRVFGRMRKTVDTDVIRVQVRVGGPENGVAQVELDEVTLPETSNLRLLDLGLMQLPVGVAAEFRGPTGVPLPVEGAQVQLHAARDSGTGNLDIDYLLFVPADDLLSFAELTATWNPSADSGVVFDSTADLLYVHRDTGNVIVNSGIGNVDGGLPRLRPGVTNRIYFLDGVGSEATNVVGVSRVLEVSYWPQYLYVKPVAS